MGSILRRCCLLVVPAMAVLCATSASQAVILYWTPTRAVNPPKSCYYGGSGWQYQGQWGLYLGTPIAPQYFVTAKHVGGSVGQTFTYNGQPYTTVAQYASPNSDLQIWKVSGTFSTYAPLYTASTEVDKTMVVFGRGTQRGDPVIVGGEQKGWYWGSSDNVQSWGSNKVSGIASGGAGVGQLLAFDFASNGDYYEAHLSTGDSGGGVFIQDGGIWKLAGINYAVDGPYSLSGSGSGFQAAIYDLGGLYVRGPNNSWVLVPDQAEAIPGASYATRVSANLGWIYSVTGPIATVPEPASLLLALAGGWGLLARRRRQRSGAAAA